MYLQIGDESINTENCGKPVVISFRMDELHNMLMSLLKNPDMTKIAVFPPAYEKKYGIGAKKKFMDLVPVPETPEVTKSAIKFLRKAAIAKLAGSPEHFEVEDGDESVVKELGGGLDS